jgi:hypothetical protein
MLLTSQVHVHWKRYRKTYSARKKYIYNLKGGLYDDIRYNQLKNSQIVR